MRGRATARAFKTIAEAFCPSVVKWSLLLLTVLRCKACASAPKPDSKAAVMALTIATVHPIRCTHEHRVARSVVTSTEIARTWLNLAETETSWGELYTLWVDNNQVGLP